MTRWKLTPHVYTSDRLNRICEYGIRISAVQPSESRLTRPSQTPSQELSSQSSL